MALRSSALNRRVRSEPFCIVTPPLASGLEHEVRRRVDTAIPIANKILINGSLGL